MKKHKLSAKPGIIVLSVGGSLVVPNGQIDVKFLCGFKKLIESQVKKGWHFVIVVGGGGTARHYQNAAKQVGKLSAEDLDWLGIHSTRLNGHLIRTIFQNIAHPEMFNDPRKVPKTWQGKVLVAAGWRPGWSTDYVATMIAKRLGAKLVVNLSNIDYLYTADPRKNKNATPIGEIAWKDFRKIVGNKWDPGMSAPFDPVAAKLAQKAKMSVILANGKRLANLEKMLKGHDYIGTIIT